MRNLVLLCASLCAMAFVVPTVPALAQSRVWVNNPAGGPSRVSTMRIALLLTEATTACVGKKSLQRSFPGAGFPFGTFMFTTSPTAGTACGSSSWCRRTRRREPSASARVRLPG